MMPGSDFSPRAALPRPLRARHLLALAVVAVAAWLRLGGLGDEPLSAPEADRAWRAWSLVEASSSLAPAGSIAAEPSPLLESLHGWMFSFGADGDASVRLPGALAGLALVVLALTLSAGMGRGPALALAALLAVDPTLVAISRRQGEIALGLLLGALLVVPFAGRARTPTQAAGSPLRSGAWSCGLGLLVASGWAAWALLPAFLGALLWRALRPSAPPAVAAAREPVAAGVRWGWLALGAGAGATGAFFLWPGLAGLSGSLTSFLGHFGSGCPEVSGGNAFARLLRADPVAFGLGPAALLALLPGLRRRAGLAALALAATAGLALVVATAGAPEALGLAAPPLLALLVFAGASAAFGRRPADGNLRDERVVGLNVVLVLALTLSLALAARARDPGREAAWRDLLAPPADSEVRLLAADLRDGGPGFGRRAPGQGLALELSRWPDPLLGWYLRRSGAVPIFGPEQAAAAGPMADVVTRDGATPSPWIVRPPASVELGRRYRVRPAMAARPPAAAWTSAVDRVTLWRVVGWGGGLGGELSGGEAGDGPRDE